MNQEVFYVVSAAARIREEFETDCCCREIMSWLGTKQGIYAGLVDDQIM
jgi:hypothetical protein